MGLGWCLYKWLHLGGWIIIAGLLIGVITSYVLLIEDLRALTSTSGTTPDEKKE